jgi:23S rRNA (cytosine1962-C5)-methyltransferase
MPRLVLLAGREASVLRRHPWIFSGAVAAVDSGVAAGDSVLVESAGGEVLGWAAFSPASKICARMWNWDGAEAIDGAFFRRRVAAALARRAAHGVAATARRIVHGEADGLPGVIADQFGNVLVLQLLAAGAERWRDDIAQALLADSGAGAMLERSEAEVRRLEGLAARTAWLAGEARDEVEIDCGGLRFGVDLAGQKTGFYLDQRANRAAVAAYAAGRDVLDCFCYSGGFALACAAAGAASVLALDSSASAIDRAAANAHLNGIDRCEFLQADVFKALRELRAGGRQFDLIVLDPPKLAPTVASLSNAARAYKDLNLLALKLLRRGGLLASFSCSAAMDLALFDKVLAGAAIDANVDAMLRARFIADTDHPVSLVFPEGAYLKGVLLEVT